jgi:hypothetical protein
MKYDTKHKPAKKKKQLKIPISSMSMGKVRVTREEEIQRTIAQRDRPFCGSTSAM